MKVDLKQGVSVDLIWDWFGQQLPVYGKYATFKYLSILFK